MLAYIAAMRSRLAAKQIGAKREFLQEVVKEVRVRGSNSTLTYKLPVRTSEFRFFTPLKLVGPPGLEPARRKIKCTTNLIELAEIEDERTLLMVVSASRIIPRITLQITSKPKRFRCRRIAAPACER
jgi:hypothetical protein